MRKSRIASLVAVGAIFLPLLASTAPAIAASPRTVPRIGTQLAVLMGSDTVESSDFGLSVAISGTTVVVGASAYPHNGGRVYVFAKTETGWTQEAELKGSDTSDDEFGMSVAISGTTIVVGAPGPYKGSTGRAFGRAYVFTKTATGWAQVDALTGSDQSTQYNSEFGASVAVSGETIVVGAPGASQVAEDAGQAYVFTETATGWKQVAELNHSDSVTGSGFGASVAISGETIVVGAPGGYGVPQEAGQAYVFTETATGWKQVAELKAPSYTGADNEFGWSVAISGTTIFVGTQYSNCGGEVAGDGAYVFTKTAGVWTQAPDFNRLRIGCNQGGISGAISGTTVVVGTRGGPPVKVFTKKAARFQPVAVLVGSNAGFESDFGWSVAISGETIVVGAPEADNDGQSVGKVYVFEA